MPLENVSDADWDTIFDINVNAAFSLCRAAAPGMKRAGGGRIVNISSGAGLHGNVGQTNYSAAKAGIAAMTVVNAMELNRYGVRANCIAPVARTRQRASRRTVP